MLLLFVLLLQTGGAPASVERPREPSNAPAAGPVTLTLRIADGREAFRPGEVIPIELEFNSSIPKHFAVDGGTYDRSGRLTIDEFVVEPNDAVMDPLLDYFSAAGPTIGGGLRSVGVLGEKPFVVELDLNDWFRFDVPGRYRLSVRSRRLTDEAQRTESEQSIVPVESNEVAFEILPRDGQWEAAQVASALPLLNSNQDVERAKGCRILRFLANEAAVTELIARFTGNDVGCGFDAVAGVYSAPNRAFVVRQMEAGLLAPGQPVSPHYIRTLAILSVYLQLPELRPAQTREAKGRHVAAGALADRSDLVRAAEECYLDRLMSALPQKTDAARALTRPSIRMRAEPVVGRLDAGDELAVLAEIQRQLLHFRHAQRDDRLIVTQTSLLRSIPTTSSLQRFAPRDLRHSVAPSRAVERLAWLRHGPRR